MTAPRYRLVIEAGHHLDTKEHPMPRPHEGLPAAASVEQAICLAQLQILRQLERQRRPV